MYDIIINEISFEWNEEKNEINKNKHGISFEEAASVFFDDYGLLFGDPVHSLTEERFNIIGYSNKNHICIVTHCIRENPETIRIISARKTTRKERNIYEKNKRKRFIRFRR